MGIFLEDRRRLVFGAIVLHGISPSRCGRPTRLNSFGCGWRVRLSLDAASQRSVVAGLTGGIDFLDADDQVQGTRDHAKR